MRQRPGERHAVGQTSFWRSPRVGIAEDAEPEVAHDADRLHRLADQDRGEEVGRVEAEAALVAGVRQLGGEPEAERRPTSSPSDSNRIFVPMTSPRRRRSMSPVAVTMSDSGAVDPGRDRRRL